MTGLEFSEVRKKLLTGIIEKLRFDLESWSYFSIEGGDSADITEQEKEHQNVLRFRRRTLNYIEKLKKSIAQVEAGTYGACLECDQNIEIERLNARPTANLCISCKEEQELEESKVYRLSDYKRKEKALVH